MGQKTVKFRIEVYTLKAGEMTPSSKPVLKTQRPDHLNPQKKS